jgi:hypothetical protein
VTIIGACVRSTSKQGSGELTHSSIKQCKRNIKIVDLRQERDYNKDEQKVDEPVCKLPRKSDLERTI